MRVRDLIFLLTIIPALSAADFASKASTAVCVSFAEAGKLTLVTMDRALAAKVKGAVLLQ